jgi:hypothetical protein
MKRNSNQFIEGSSLCYAYTESKIVTQYKEVHPAKKKERENTSPSFTFIILFFFAFSKLQ